MAPKGPSLKFDPITMMSDSGVWELHQMWGSTPKGLIEGQGANRIRGFGPPRPGDAKPFWKGRSIHQPRLHSLELTWLRGEWPRKEDHEIHEPNRW